MNKESGDFTNTCKLTDPLSLIEHLNVNDPPFLY